MRRPPVGRERHFQPEKGGVTFGNGGSKVQDAKFVGGEGLTQIGSGEGNNRKWQPCHWQWQDQSLL
jgi:hypothetical protein